MRRLRRDGSIVALAGFALFVCACGGKTKTEPIPEAEWAHARVITAESDLIGGPAADAQLGDYLLINSKARFIIQDGSNANTWLNFGGGLIDADIVRAPGEAGQDHLIEVAPLAGLLRATKPTSIEIVSDGTGGEPAIVRVIGPDTGIALIDAVAPRPPTSLELQTDYILEPNATSLRIETSYRDTSGDQRTRVVQAGDAVYLGSLLTMCIVPDDGCTDSPQANSARIIGGYSPGIVSYAYFAPDRTSTVLLRAEGVMLMGGDMLDVNPGETATYTRYVAVGDGDLASVLPEIRSREEITESRVIAGHVGLETGADGAWAAIDVYDSAGEFFTRAIAADDGSFELSVRPGDYTLVASLPLRPPSTDLPVDVTTADASALEMELADVGRVNLDIRDGSGNPVPARVNFLAGANPSPGAGATVRYYSVDGTGEVFLPPGEYVAAVTRGYEYDYDWVPVTSVAGETSDLPATIVRVVDTTGFISADLHTHTRHSVDSTQDEWTRVAQAAAQHVELVVTTEHDNSFDMSSTIEDVGGEDFVTTAQGIEVSPLYGHMNAYPVTYDNAPRLGFWPVRWWETNADGNFVRMLDPAELFPLIRADMGALVIQLNHPREGTGILDFVDYDPTVGFAGVDPAVMSTDFNAIEIFNAGWDSTDQQSMEDWFSFISQGLPITGVGVSDDHGLGRVGRVRTMVEVPDDNTRLGMDLQAVWDSLRSQRATVMSGPFVLLYAVDDQDGEHGLGQVATRTTGMVRLRVVIRAAPFVQTTRLRIIANGVEEQLINIPDPGDPRPADRYDNFIDIDWTAQGQTDGWFVAIVEGDQPMFPFTGDTPRSITNPVFVDRDGDGSFTAPGL